MRAEQHHEILSADAVLLGQKAVDRDDAVRQCGEVLLKVGAVEPAYIDTMHLRERSLSTHLGESVAIPHGTDEGRVFVKRTALGFLQFPDGVDWDGDEVKVCIPIAARGREHLRVLAALAHVLIDPDQAEELRSATDVEQVLRLLQPISEEKD